jgi:hypothetical protein
MQSPRVSVVFRLRQCDKENQGWREGPPLTVACQSSDLPAGPSPSGNFKFERKKNTAFSGPLRALTQNIGRFKTACRGNAFCQSVRPAGQRGDAVLN